MSRTVSKPGMFVQLKLEKDGNSYFSTLEINDVTLSDAGKYQVTAKNELGESHATISLNFDSDEPASDEGVKPTFTEKPVIKQEDDFKTVIFECRLIADPAPTIQWLHKGSLVKEDSRHKYQLSSDKHNHTASLVIKQVTGKDGGEYKAVAKNAHGEGSANINLNFEGEGQLLVELDPLSNPTSECKLRQARVSRVSPVASSCAEAPLYRIPSGKAPRFPKKPTIKQTGDALVMECVLEASPLPDISWHLGPKVIKDGARHKIAQKPAGPPDTYLLTLEIKMALLLQDPTVEDGGNYRCHAVNEFGESNANIALNLQGEPKEEGTAPHFIDKPKMIPKDDGALILMTFKCKSKPKPEFAWTKNDQPVKESSRIKVEMIDHKNDEYTIQLTVKDPGDEDAGIYKCAVKNAHGDLNAKLNLNLEAEKESGVAPTFIEKPKITSLQDGKVILMECKVKADPKPNITWTNDGETVKEGGRIVQTIKQNKDVYDIKLEIRDVEVTDAGLYRCHVSNSAGECNANLTLNIEVVPVVKEKPRIIKKEINKAIVIEVKVTSVKEPKCVWLRQDTSIKEDSRHVVQTTKVTKGEYSVQLKIEKPTADEKGSYKLVVKNEKGEATSTEVFVDFEGQ
ncbi:unc-22 [Cordylochernes scorpioides]|uniref:Unc-22 n=1 Tax=Cordylochernes scorpioides TaxID=51811 RepID=A0ABY6KAS1_9ARAC|nr:unc-22 [Cordylochernes scorpioides]